MTDHDQPSRAQAFGRYVAEAARAAGYDIDSPRGGGKLALAQAAGMSRASVSRMVAGQTIPDPTFFEPLARALGLQLPQLLIRSGLASEQALSGLATPRLTIRQAAEALGIRSERGIQLFTTVVRGILDQEPTEDPNGGRGAA